MLHVILHILYMNSRLDFTFLAYYLIINI